MENEVTRNNDKVAEDNLEAIAENEAIRYNAIGAKVMPKDIVWEAVEGYYVIRSITGPGIKFTPYTDIAHAMMVLDEMVEKGWDIDIYYRNEGQKYIQISTWNWVKNSKRITSSAPLKEKTQAIMKAVSKAMEEEK